MVDAGLLAVMVMPVTVLGPGLAGDRQRVVLRAAVEPVCVHNRRALKHKDGGDAAELEADPLDHTVHPRWRRATESG
jgi:hypothetical protein